MRSWILAVLWVAAGGVSLAGTPGEADAIVSAYRRDMSAWMEKMRAAATPAQQKAVQAGRPDAEACARRMWRCIGGQLDEEWTLKPAAWLFRMGVGLRGGAGMAASQPGAKPSRWVGIISKIRTSVKLSHLQSKNPGMVNMCMALVDLPDPETLGLLEKIEAGNPDPKMQGVAALAISMVLKNLGDEGEVMARRLRMLRKAIVNSSEIEVEPGLTVAKISEDELYVISRLSKGRTAPDLVGTDVAGRPLRLSSYDGKVVVLLFWAAWNENSPQVVEMAKRLKKKMAGRPFELVGVNADSLASLKRMVGSGAVDWPNFSDPDRKLAAEYRVTAWPIVFVLDKKRVIRYIGAPGSFVDLTADALLGE
jgi:peroxiredoxin